MCVSEDDCSNQSYIIVTTPPPPGVVTTKKRGNNLLFEIQNDVEEDPRDCKFNFYCPVSVKCKNLEIFILAKIAKLEKENEKLKEENEKLKEELTKIKESIKENNVELYPKSNVFIEKEKLETIIFNRSVMVAL